MARKPIEVETLTHDATRKNIPTAEFESIMREQDKTPIRLAYERRNPDLDPQLVWRGKDMEDWSDLIVQAPPLYIQEKVHPKVLIDELKRESRARAEAQADPAPQFDMFADFNGLPDAEAATEFYQHDAHWSNRMISGDSLSVMASLAEREGLRGQVQCIYFDPPYGIKFNSNFQWSTTSRDVKDGDKGHITREPEQVRAFRDTWRDGIHSYLTYLRDRLTVARDLLTESGSIFVQIGDENVHRVRALMDEVLGEKNFVNTIVFKKKSSTLVTETVFDLIVWYCRNSEKIKVRTLYEPRAEPDEEAKFNTVVMPDIALARSRLMGARYPYYLLADSAEGQQKEAEITRTPPKSAATYGSIRQGFVYDRVPHITLKSIANNAEIDVIWDRLQPTVEDAIAALNAALAGHTTPFKVEQGGRAGAKIDFTATGEVKLPSGEMAPTNGFMEWEIPREAPSGWPAAAQTALARLWEARIARQKEIDASISAKAEFEFLYDKPFADNTKVRAAGPFTVESLSPHRTLVTDWNDELIDLHEAAEGKRRAAGRDDRAEDFAQMILENLRAAGVQQAHKEDRISFTALTGWPGRYIAAEAQFMEGEVPRRAGIFIGPEFGTVSRPDLVAAAREAGDAGFDMLIACAFNYDAHSAEFDKLGRVPVLKARMNPDLHMGGDLKSTGAGNLFVIFGEPDIRIEEDGDMLTVQVFGVDVFKRQTGEVQSEGTDGIALWMLDTDYNEEAFFVRHAYFLGANDPYKALKTSLKAEIDEDAWDSLYSDKSRPFPKPKSGRIAVKVINHLGDEMMKVFGVG